MENMINKRRYTRVPISGLAALVLEEKGEIHSIQTVIANISLRGIGLYSYNSIKVKTSVSITINFISADGILKTNSIEGCVIRNKKIDNTYFIGIQFNEEINARNQPSLFKHLQNSFQQINF
jgi:c-di-GMP-binding flagellar brake protein YcgR